MAILRPEKWRRFGSGCRPLMDFPNVAVAADAAVAVSEHLPPDRPFGLPKKLPWTKSTEKNEQMKRLERSIKSDGGDQYGRHGTCVPLAIYLDLYRRL